MLLCSPLNYVFILMKQKILSTASHTFKYPMGGFYFGHSFSVTLLCYSLPYIANRCFAHRCARTNRWVCLVVRVASICDQFSVSAKGFDGNNIYVTATLRLPDCKMCVNLYVCAYICVFVGVCMHVCACVRVCKCVSLWITCCIYGHKLNCLLLRYAVWELRDSTQVLSQISQLCSPYSTHKVPPSIITIICHSMLSLTFRAV